MSEKRATREGTEKKLGLALNLLSFVLVAYCAVILFQRHFGYSADHKGPDGAALSVGEKVPIDVDWHRNRHTLVMVLQVGCHFCSESAPFYRALLKKQAQGDWQAIAVLPQSVRAATAYMTSAGYSPSRVLQMDMSAVGALYTPTLFLVDGNGKLQQQWIGALQRAGENDVASHLGISGISVDEVGAAPEVESDDYTPLVTTSELLRLLKSPGKINLLDVRGRSHFDENHITNALNIPVDELEIRAPHELVRGAPTFLYCEYSVACQVEGRKSLCSISMDALRDAGISNVRVIRDEIPLLAEAGVPASPKQSVSSAPSPAALAKPQ